MKTPLRRQLIDICKSNNEDWKGLCYSKSVIICRDKVTNDIMGFMSFQHDVRFAMGVYDPSYLMNLIRCVYYTSTDIFNEMILFMDSYSLLRGCHLVIYGGINTKHSEALLHHGYDGEYYDDYTDTPNSYSKEIQDKSMANYIVSYYL